MNREQLVERLVKYFGLEAGGGERKESTELISFYSLTGVHLFNINIFKAKDGWQIGSIEHILGGPGWDALRTLTRAVKDM